jgi:hypothetical protein
LSVNVPHEGKEPADEAVGLDVAIRHQTSLREYTEVSVDDLVPHLCPIVVVAVQLNVVVEKLTGVTKLDQACERLLVGVDHGYPPGYLTASFSVDGDFEVVVVGEGVCFQIVVFNLLAGRLVGSSPKGMVSFSDLLDGAGNPVINRPNPMVERKEGQGKRRREDEMEYLMCVARAVDM